MNHFRCLRMRMKYVCDAGSEREKGQTDDSVQFIRCKVDVVTTLPDPEGLVRVSIPGTLQQKFTYQNGRTEILGLVFGEMGGLFVQRQGLDLPPDIAAFTDGTVHLHFLEIGKVGDVSEQLSIEDLAMLSGISKIFGLSAQDEVIYVSECEILKQSDKAQVIEKIIGGIRFKAVRYNNIVYVNLGPAFPYLEPENGETIFFPNAEVSGLSPASLPSEEGTVYIVNRRTALRLHRDDFVFPEMRKYWPTGSLVDRFSEPVLVRHLEHV